VPKAVQAAPRKSARGIARKEKIVAVATRFLARNGARGTTLGEIAAEAGVSQAGLLYHFPTKEELLHAVLDSRDDFEDALLWRKGPDPGLEIFGIVADIVGSWSEHPEIVGLVAVLVAENVGDDGALRPRLASKYQLTVDRIASTLSAGQQRGEIRADVDAREKAIEILAFLSGLELAWLVSPDIPAADTASAWAALQVSSLRPAAVGASSGAPDSRTLRRYGRRSGATTDG
jgi:AcrR family transcriptional regulator